MATEVVKQKLRSWKNEFGFNQTPKILSRCRLFTSTERLIIEEVFNSMSIEEDRTTTISNTVLSELVGCGISSITKCKKRVQELGLFKLHKRFEQTDRWVLSLEIPEVIVNDYLKSMSKINILLRGRDSSNIVW